MLEPAAPDSSLPALPLPQELEWQLAGADLGRVQRWLNDHATVAGLSIEARPTQLLRDRYFDTADWRLHRAGFALRIRGIEGGAPEATLKSLHSSRADAALRTELSEPLNAASFDALQRSTGPVAARVHAVVGREPLQALFDVRTRRRRYAVRGGARGEVGEIALDATEFARPSGEPSARAERVEVEALAPDAPLEALVGVLCSECGLEGANGSKFALGLESVGLEPPVQARIATPEAAAALGVEALARGCIGALLAKWRLHEPAARRGDDPEELHELRNSVRRLAVVLGLYADFLPPRLARARDQLKALQATLGVARDFDVALAQLAAFAEELTADERVGLEALIAHERAARARARLGLVRALDAAATRRLVETLALAVDSPFSLRPPRRQGPAAKVVPVVIRKRYRKLKRALASLGPDSPSEAYHLIRSQVKKFRYAIETTADLYGKPAGSLLRELRRLQDRLGQQQDAYMGRQRLDALANVKPALPPATLFLMGRIAERHATSISGARARLGRPGRRLKRRWKRLRAAFAAVRARELPAEPKAP